MALCKTGVPRWHTHFTVQTLRRGKGNSTNFLNVVTAYRNTITGRVKRSYLRSCSERKSESHSLECLSHGRR